MKRRTFMAGALTLAPVAALGAGVPASEERIRGARWLAEFKPAGQAEWIPVHAYPLYSVMATHDMPPERVEALMDSAIVVIVPVEHRGSGIIRMHRSDKPETVEHVGILSTAREGETLVINSYVIHRTPLWN